MTRKEEGFALPFMILVLLILGLFGHGILVLSRHQLQATWALRHLARADAAARLGLEAAMAIPLDSAGARTSWADVPLLAGETPDGLGYSVVRRWLDQEFFLLESRGTSRGWKGERLVIWVGWTQHPGGFLRTFLSPGPSWARRDQAPGPS